MSPLLHPPGLGRGGTLTTGTTSAAEVQLRWPGLDPLEPTLDLLVFDDSGSLTGAGGNDPVGNRYAEAHHAVDLLSQWTMTSRQKIAVLHFDYPHVKGDGPHRLDQTRTRDQVLRALNVPSGAYGSSALAPAMTAANRLARDHGGITRCTIFSDFELTDAQPLQPYEEIAAFPGAVHAVVLNANPPSALTELPNMTITRLSSDSPPGLAAAALMHSLTTGRRGARRASLRTGQAREPTPR